MTLTEINSYKIITIYNNYKKNTDALLYITSDVLSLRKNKIDYSRDKLNLLTKDKVIDINIFKKIQGENEALFNDNEIYSQKFNYLFFNSIFINLFSLFELFLSNTGKICETIDGNNVKIKDIKGDGTIDTSRKYFYLILDIESASNKNEQWKEIKEFKAIRNSIVHNSNKLNLQKNKNHNSLVGFKKIKEFNIKYWGEEMLFEINNIEFIYNFRNICINYSLELINEILKKHSELHKK